MVINIFHQILVFKLVLQVNLLILVLIHVIIVIPPVLNAVDLLQTVLHALADITKLKIQIHVYKIVLQTIYLYITMYV